MLIKNHKVEWIDGQRRMKRQDFIVNSGLNHSISKTCETKLVETSVIIKKVSATSHLWHCSRVAILTIEINASLLLENASKLQHGAGFAIVFLSSYGVEISLWKARNLRKWTFPFRVFFCDNSRFNVLNVIKDSKSMIQPPGSTTLRPRMISNHRLKFQTTSDSKLCIKLHNASKMKRVCTFFIFRDTFFFTSLGKRKCQWKLCIDKCLEFSLKSDLSSLTCE